MDALNYMEILMHILYLYVSWTTDVCNERAENLVRKAYGESS